MLFNYQNFYSRISLLHVYIKLIWRNLRKADILYYKHLSRQPLLQTFVWTSFITNICLDKYVIFLSAKFLFSMCKIKVKISSEQRLSVVLTDLFPTKKVNLNHVSGQKNVRKVFVLYTAKNTVISPNFAERQFPH